MAVALEKEHSPVDKYMSINILINWKIVTTLNYRPGNICSVVRRMSNIVL